MRITYPNLVAITAFRCVKKSFRFRTGYGEKPILRAEDLQEDKIEELKYKQIRFAALVESCSPLVDPLHERFTNHCLQGGDRPLAYHLMHDTFYYIKRYQIAKLRKEKKQLGLGEEEEEEIITDPMEILHRGVKNCEPVVIVNKVKRGGAIYQVPYPISQKQGEWFAMKWLYQAVKERPKPRVKHFGEVMAQELIDAAYGKGKVVKKKDDIHRLAVANKAYAHYRWG